MATRDECYLEFVAEQLPALLRHDDERVRDLLADVRATLLPGSVLREVRSMLLLPPDGVRAPMQTLRHLRLTELELDLARRRGATSN